MSSSLWWSVEILAEGAVLYEWRDSLGISYETARPLLAPTNSLADSYPCRGRVPCECRHRVIPNVRGEILAVCDCEHHGCAAIALEPKDVMVHALDRRKLGAALRLATGFEAVPYEDKERRWIRIGKIRKLAANVFWSSPGDERALMVVIEELSRTGESFLLLTPTKRLHTGVVESLAMRGASVIAAAEDWFQLDGPGRFICSQPIDELVAALDRLVARKPATAEVLERIDTRIESIRGEHQGLKDENAELKRLQADGYFKFAEKAAPDDFLAFAFIMAGSSDFLMGDWAAE
jgi:hypothetical protein